MMKRSMKTVVMAFVAMFAFNTIADAQISIGGYNINLTKKKKTTTVQAPVKPATPTTPAKVAETPAAAPQAAAKAVEAPAAAPQAAAKASVEMVSYDGEKFSCQYPKEYVGQEDSWFPGVLNVWKKDDKHQLSIWPEEYGDAKLDNLKDWGAIMKQDFEEKDEGWKVDEPVIKNNILTIRMVAGEVVQYYYTIVLDGKYNNVTGKMSFLVSEEAKYKPVFDAVLASIKVKQPEK